AVALLALEGREGTRHRLELEAILLPLVHGGTRITRIIGAMSAATPTPWLETRPLSRVELLRRELLWPDGHPPRFVAKQARATPLPQPPPPAPPPPPPCPPLP